MSIFTDLVIRSNGQRVHSGWFNSIRTALVSYFGTGAIGQTVFTMTNNQSSAADVTGLTLDGAVTTSAIISYEILRTSAAPTVRMESGEIALLFKDGTWELEYIRQNGDNALGSGKLFTVTTATNTAQVQYETDDIAGGTNTDVMNFRTLSTMDA